MSIDFSGFFDALCDRRSSIQMLFSLTVLILVLQIPYLLVVEQDSALFVLSILNSIGASFFAVVSGLVLLKCRSG